MEDAYALLGINSSATLEEIEEAYREKKRLSNPERYLKDSRERQAAFVLNQELDKAYCRVSSAFMAPSAAYRHLPHLPAVPWGEFITLLAISPIITVLLQYFFPSLFWDLLSDGMRRAVWLSVSFVTIFSYLPSLFLRFFFFKRPLQSWIGRLGTFFITLCFCDVLSSLLIYVSFGINDKGFLYVPVFYLTGLGPLFILLLVHTQVLSFPPARPREVSPFFRLFLFSLTITLSVLFSLALAVFFNEQRQIPLKDHPPEEGIIELSTQEEPWESLELLDAGVWELPKSWYIEDSNGKLHVTRNGYVVQYVREVLAARPYGGRRQSGPDFAFEVLSYWWTREDGQLLLPPAGTVEKTLNHQLQALKQDYPDIEVVERIKREEYGGWSLSSFTAETRLIPSYVVRFKNAVIRYESKLFFVTVSYPAEDEPYWEFLLARILRRWKPAM